MMLLWRTLGGGVLLHQTRYWGVEVQTRICCERLLWFKAEINLHTIIYFLLRLQIYTY